jgi:hypothetical protein
MICDKPGCHGMGLDACDLWEKVDATGLAMPR